MHTKVKYFLSLLIWLGFTFFYFVPFRTSAHELEPTSMSPNEGEVLQQSPKEVRLTFAEELQEDGSNVQVFNEQGVQVDLGGGGVDLNNIDHNSLVVQLPDLPEGVYRVKWSVILLDGDSSEGGYYFGVGNVTVPETMPEDIAGSQPDEENHEAGTGTPILFWVGLGGGFVVIAALVFYVVNKSRRNP